VLATATTSRPAYIVFQKGDDTLILKKELIKNEWVIEIFGT